MKYSVARQQCKGNIFVRHMVVYCWELHVGRVYQGKAFLRSYSNSRYHNAPECYIIRILPLLFVFDSSLWSFSSSSKESYKIFALDLILRCYSNSRYKYHNAPECYIIRILPLLFVFDSSLWSFSSSSKESYKIFAVDLILRCCRRKQIFPILGARWI